MIALVLLQQNKRVIIMQCETCMYSQYDDEYDEYICNMVWDEDVAARQMQGFYSQCPYYRNGDDYSIVRKQN